MPNVPPRGLYGCLTQAGPFLPAKDVFAVKPDEEVFSPAQFVWVWCGTNETGGWQVVWGRTVTPPVSATAAYEATGTQVRVTWVLPTPNVASAWKVYRPDGSLAGTTANATTAELVDPTPLPGVGTYKVVGTDGSVDSAQVATNSLDINLQPATATAVHDGSGNIAVSWTPHATQGQPDGWSIWNETDSAWMVADLPGALRTTLIVGLTRGKTYVFRVYPVLSGATGTYRATAATGIPANVPTSVALAAINPPATGAASADQIQLSWVAPSGAVTGYEVQQSTNGTTWTASASSTSPVVVVSAVPLYMRVRTLSAGGASDWVQKGPVSPHPDSPPLVPNSVTLTALTSPLSTLRLTWTAGTGATSYEVETSTNNSTWTASADDTTPSDWSTTTATGYMRVRSVSAGGVSAWVTKGPVAAINDTTPPATPVITSFKPESSYGRMVVRFTTANVSDFGAYRVDYNADGGAYVIGSWVAANPNVATAVVVGTWSAGQTPGVRVYYRDDTLNVSAADTATYTLVASPKIIDATDSATWRGSAWRTDGTAGSTGVMHGRTSSGENYGCWFYGEALQDFVSTHTVVSATLDYCRDGSSQGSGSAIQPGVWVHNHATQPAGTPVSSFTDGPVLGTGVARSGTTGGSCALSAAQIAQLATYKGLGVYRSTSNTNDADAASFYMRLYPFGTNSGGKISGRVTLNHLG